MINDRFSAENGHGKARLSVGGESEKVGMVSGRASHDPHYYVYKATLVACEGGMRETSLEDGNQFRKLFPYYR